MSSPTSERGNAKRPAHRTRRRAFTPQEEARAHTIRTWRRVGTVLCGVLLAGGAVVGLLLSARPSVSAVENRMLTTFPAFSWDAFWSGSYFEDVALWYSDTYPVREQMVQANKALDALHGIPTQTQMIGGTRQADELPPIDDATAQSQAADDPSAASTQSANDPSPTGAQGSGDTQTGTAAQARERTQVEVPSDEAVAEAVQAQITEGLYVKGDAAYNVYYFSQEAVQGYADMLNTLAATFGNGTTLYSMVVPTSAAVVLPDEEAASLGGTNQADALKYFYSLYDPSVVAVDVMDILRAHANEYIYFRTDHHWTSRGSYWGYAAFCEQKGIAPEGLDELRYQNMGDFLGSYYYELNSDAMAANPDYLEVWYPNATNELTLYDTDGSTQTYPIVSDFSDQDALSKDMTLIMGDQPLEHIQNPKLSDGSSCLVIKDSFADSLVPFLVDHYQSIWIADFRYFEGSYADLVTTNSIDDVLVLNSISLAGGGAVAPSILGRL